MRECNFIHENFHTKQSFHSARRTHAYITQLYIMSIQPANKAVKQRDAGWSDRNDQEVNSPGSRSAAAGRVGDTTR